LRSTPPPRRCPTTGSCGDRELTLLSGEALELRFGDGRTTRLAPGERVRFAGEDPVVGVPVGGATEQLNLMWRRDLVTAVQPVAVEGDSTAFVVRLSAQADG
jgi:environmental stress-induced protein Ves